MASIHMIAQIYSSDLKFSPDKWVIVWRHKDHWQAISVHRDLEAGMFDKFDVPEMRKALQQDENAVILNGRVCGVQKRGISAVDMASWIRQQYKDGNRLLKYEI